MAEQAVLRLRNYVLGRNKHLASQPAVGGGVGENGEVGNVGECCEKWSIFAQRILEDFGICCARRGCVLMLPHARGRNRNRRASIRCERGWRWCPTAAGKRGCCWDRVSDRNSRANCLGGSARQACYAAGGQWQAGDSSCIQSIQPGGSEAGRTVCSKVLRNRDGSKPAA